MPVAPVAVTSSASVRPVGLHIHGKPTRSAADPTGPSRSEDRHETSGGSGVGNTKGDRREYGMISTILQLAPFYPFSFLPLE